MARRGDGIRVYQIKGKTMFLARVRVKDANGKLIEKSKACQTRDEAKLWQAQELPLIKIGKSQKETERSKLSSAITLTNLIDARIEQLKEDKIIKLRKDPIAKGSDNIGYLETFKKRNPEICSLPIGELDRGTFNQYRKKRYAIGMEKSTVNRELSVIRKTLALAREGDLDGSFSGVCLDVDPRIIKFEAEDNIRDRWLESYSDDREIFKAIEEQCRTDLLKRRWLTFVVLALSTGLRRGVMLKLTWEDVKITSTGSYLIQIKKQYWEGKKRAPPYVPVSKNLRHHLAVYYSILPHNEKTSKDRLFPYEPRGCQSTWERIIERTTLYKMVMKNGVEERDYINIHALRHTCETRYGQEPFGLLPEEYGWLLGHRIGTRTQARYDHWTDHRHRAMCEKIRIKINNGDMELANQFKEKGERRPDHEASSKFFGETKENVLSLEYQYQDKNIAEKTKEFFKVRRTYDEFQAFQAELANTATKRTKRKKVQLVPRDPNYSIGGE